MKRLRFNWSRWHRRLGVITCVGVVLWGLSGLSHPVMSRLQPKPAVFKAPSASLNLTSAMDPSQVLPCSGISQFQRMNIINVGNATVYRVAVDSHTPARYFSATDCQELTAGDEYYARELASHYTGRPVSEIADASFVTQFDEEYMSVNRLLPVWRIEFTGSGHLRAYIDTDQARLSTLIDDTRMVMGNIFRWGHNWSFLENTPRLQLVVMVLVLGTALSSAISGLTLYLRRRRHSKERRVNQPARHWHRRLGLLVAITTLTFAASGMFHLVMSYRQQVTANAYVTPLIEADNVSRGNWQQIIAQPAHRIDLVQSPSGLQWLLRNDMPPARVAELSHANHGADHHEHSHGASPSKALPVALMAAGGEGTQLPQDMLALARSQAIGFAGLPEVDIVQTQLVTRFGGEYGFIFKRLPVVRVQFAGPGNPRYYIEPATGALAAEVRDIDATEGKSFAYLHKWTWLDANKDVRDVLMMLFALGNILVALLGIWLFARRVAEG